MVRECAFKGCTRPAQFMKCNKHTDQVVVPPVKDRYPRKVLDWGNPDGVKTLMGPRWWREGPKDVNLEDFQPHWFTRFLGVLVASTISGFLALLSSYGRMITGIGQAGLKGFFTLVVMHIAFLIWISMHL